MADNATYQTSTLATLPDGTVVAADDVGGALIPRGKIVIGADGSNDGDVSAANPLPVLQKGASTLAGNQVDVTNSATQIVASRSGRRSVTVVNLGTTAVYLGPANTVVTTTGLLLPGIAGAAVTFDYTGDVYGITASGTQRVAYAEEY